MTARNTRRGARASRRNGEETPATADAAAPEAGMEVVRTRRGWAVRFGDGTRTEDMTKRAANGRMASVVAHRARVAAAEAEHAAAIAALLAEHDIGPVDYRQLQPGDLFTWRPGEPPKVVIEARRFDSGASLIIWERGPYTPRGWNMTLMTPRSQAYGKHQTVPR